MPIFNTRKQKLKKKQAKRHSSITTIVTNDIRSFKDFIGKSKSSFNDSIEDLAYNIKNSYSNNISLGSSAIDEGRLFSAKFRFKMAMICDRRGIASYIGLMYIYSMYGDIEKINKIFTKAEKNCPDIPVAAYEERDNLIDKVNYVINNSKVNVQNVQNK